MDNGRVCPQCGRSNSPTVKFCENCGYAFPAEAAPQAADQPEKRRTQSDRSHVSGTAQYVLFQGCAE